MTTDAWGITDGFHDLAGQWHPTSDEARAAIRASMGEDVAAPSAWVIREGATDEIDGSAELTLEDGAVLRVTDRLPPDLPLGYHRRRRMSDGHEVTLIVAPHRCHLPEDTRL